MTTILILSAVALFSWLIYGDLKDAQEFENDLDVRAE
jgi:uncharacterized protein with PQ loop repeat